MIGRRIGEKSTHQVRCMVCDQTYGNATKHRCPFAGVDHANMHREPNRRIASLESEIHELRSLLGTLIRGEDDAGLPL